MSNMTLYALLISSRIKLLEFPSTGDHRLAVPRRTEGQPRVFPVSSDARGRGKGQSQSQLELQSVSDMKLCLCLVLCFCLASWSHGYAADKAAPTPTPQTQPQSQDPPQLNCNHMERLRAAHERERMQMPRGDKFDDFDWSLSKELNAVERGNIVISPISLKVVLAMLFEGARGKTAHEIGEALDLHNSTLEERRHTRERFSTILQSLQTSEGEYKIKMGTHAFIDKTADPEPNYQCKLKTYYNSDIVKVDFSDFAAAVKVINNWAKNVTEGHIQDLLSESEAQSSTIMLLLNAVYFKGQWDVPFPVNQTKLGTFHLDDQKTVKVPLMNVTEKFSYYDMSQIGAHMIELPYKGNKFAMYVVLPYNTTGLDSVVKALGPERSLSNVIDRMMPTTVNLIMPKFEYDFTTKLRPTLEKLGIKTMFSTGAELVDIAKTKSGGLVVSNVLQKAGISVTEAGTVAYAASAVDLVDKFGGSEEVIDFQVDRPFLFFIVDRTIRTTVFVGKVTNPDNAKVVSSPQDTPENPSGGNSSGTNDFDRFGHSGQSEQTSQARFNFFDGDLLQQVSNQERGNFVISPASVKTILGLIMEAAEGSTLEELQGLLRLPNNSAQARHLMGSLQTVLQKVHNSQVTVDSATNTFISKDLTFNTSYAKAISDLYKAGIDIVDFKSPENAANRINSWVSTNTRGKIPSLITSEAIDPDTMTFLVNTVYFDGKWKDEFQLKDTRDDCFYSEPKLECHKVPIMYQKEDLMYRYDKDFSSHIVQIPYQDERFSMVLVVPVSRDGMRKISRDTHRLTFPALLDKMRTTEVHLKLPRFSVEHETDLKLILTKMGLNSIFSDEAQLPFMINNRQGQVSSVIHKAKIEVSEKGTKAAAASGAAVVPLMSGNFAVLVTAEHPFYYFIYEAESKNVLFSGRVSSLAGETGSEENSVGADLAPLSSSDLSRPSYAQAASHAPATSSRPQTFPNRQSASSNVPTSTEVQFLGVENHPYNKGTTVKPSLPPVPSPPGLDAIEYPNDHGNTYLNNYRKRHFPRNSHQK